MKENIIQILKDHEQRDYKRGGVSIAPEQYEAIANIIFTIIIKHDRKLLIDYGVKIQEYIAKPPFNLEHSQHGIACEKLADVRELFLEQHLLNLTTTT